MDKAHNQHPVLCGLEHAAVLQAVPRPVYGDGLLVRLLCPLVGSVALVPGA